MCSDSSKQVPKLPPEVDPDGADFLGWVGKLIAYESKKTKMKVKIAQDRGFEHLQVDGKHKYAISSLIRLT